MSFFLGVWNSPTAISDDEAAALYRALSGEKSVDPKFDAHVYAFYCRLTSLYPEVEMVADNELASCPWDCSLDLASDHVIMAIQLEQSGKVPNSGARRTKSIGLFRPAGRQGSPAPEPAESKGQRSRGPALCCRARNRLAL